jgi:hypothetical protein
MKTRTAYRIALVSIVLGAFDSTVRAQDATNLYGAGYINLGGTTNWTPPSQLPFGNLFVWWPSQGALRFGGFSQGYRAPYNVTATSIADIGQFSIAGGQDAIAKGRGSIALGVDAYASGDQSVAIGSCGANGTYSFAGGVAQADGWGSAALAAGWAVGNYSFAACGVAKGYSSAAFNASSSVGNCSAAFGDNSLSQAYGEMAVGCFNLGLRKDGSSPDPTTAADADPVFEVGTGSGTYDSDGDPVRVPKNAFTVYRDGTVRMSKACGGISMGSFQ